MASNFKITLPANTQTGSVEVRESTIRDRKYSELTLSLDGSKQTIKTDWKRYLAVCSRM